MDAAIVILGAAVWPGGRASPALARRVGYGLAAARARPDCLIFCSGGLGRHGPSEARVMADLLQASGVDPARLVLDERSRDTLENVIAALGFLRARGIGRLIICTDTYHAPRVAMMFALLGVRTQPGPIETGRDRVRRLEWWRMSAREVLAYPYDFMVVLARRREILARTGSVGEAA
ncbi:YdcF family protein [Phenylobacterium sp.]|uniref:YdcF family protein n=1 Tax=Phenylobacterium sp. TaxID=1871053 RepID=UPI00272FFA87|nr:YdcF family protein [Phenylobacterium sp.]MDP1618674.1 YdcF family protein [Phenylobacterium sp.]MDP1986579.1 YdcF family protein [Phenylobacterium sp.]